MENSDGTRRKVALVVEDDRPIGELIAGAITDELGYLAIYVENSDAALETTKRITPDVMVIDFRLPGMSGFELYDRPQSDPRMRQVPVLFETATANENIREFRRRGIATYVKRSTSGT